MPRVVKPCAAGDYYKVTPDERMHLDLREVAEKLGEAGYELGIASPVIVTFRKGEIEMSLFSSGRIMVRGVSKPEEALRAANVIYEILR